MTEAPIIGIQRHRLSTDGKGVTTLVGFWGCRLKCRYCLNPQSWKRNLYVYYSPQKLYNEVSIDQLYFLATNGGVTFGGGEPLLYPSFITEFRNICGKTWKINVETSLNVPIQNLISVAESIDNFIVDIKDYNNVIYTKYTGENNSLTIQNLKWLTQNIDIEHIYVKIPFIPNFNTIEDTKQSEISLKKIGIKHIQHFNYQVNQQKK